MSYRLECWQVMCYPYMIMSSGMESPNCSSLVLTSNTLTFKKTGGNSVSISNGNKPGQDRENPRLVQDP
jgi:hypothetical protein